MTNDELARSIRVIPRFMHHLHHGLMPERAKDGLNFTHIKTLLILRDHGRRPMNELAARVDLDTGALSRVVQRLVLLGLVERVHDTADRRVVLAQLTRRGEEEAEAHVTDLLAHLRDRLSPLAGDQSAQLLQAIRTIEQMTDVLEGNNA